MRLVVIRESNLSTKWHVVDVDSCDIEKEWPLKPLFVGVSKNAAIAYASKKKCEVFVAKDVTVHYEDPPGSIHQGENDTLYMTPCSIGVKSPKIASMLTDTAHTKIKRVIPRSIKLVNWDTVEMAEKKAESVLSRDGKKPTREEIGNLTYLILEDLKKGK